MTAICAVLASAWLAAGSTGLLGDGLRNALALTALLLAVVAGWPGVWRAILVIGIGGGGLVLDIHAVNVVALALALLVLGSARDPAIRRAFSVGGTALVALALFLAAKTAIPAFWLMLDRVGHTLGSVAASIGGVAFVAGATFTGIDFLVLMLALWGAWLGASPKPRLVRGMAALVAILVGHGVFLLLMASAADWAGKLPAPPLPQGPIAALEPPAENLGIAAGRMLIPWNLPAVAGLIHLVIATAMLRWTQWPQRAGSTGVSASSSGSSEAVKRKSTRTGLLLSLGLVAVAGAAWLPPTTRTTTPLSLAGKKVVCYEKGFLNWLKPKWGEYGRLTIGMYGLLPLFVESLGGTCLISPDLSAEDLRDADVVVLLFPNEPWTADQLSRLREFVEQGGGLLVMGEHSSCEEGPDGVPDINAVRFNEVLAATADGLRVNFDSSTFAVGGWLSSYEPLGHPILAGVSQNRNDYGVVIGATLDVRPPARPVLIGRHGWSDPGNLGTGPAMMGNDRYDPGEKLGDQVLVGEQRVGRGKVIAFGDTSSITNGILFGSYEFISRLLGYLANRAADPHPPWRQGLGLLLALAAATGLLWHPGGLKAGAVAAALGGTLTWASIAQSGIPHELPDRRYAQNIPYIKSSEATPAWHERKIDRPTRPVDIAYIDLSHVVSVSEESLRHNALMGLHLVLLREEYLTFALPELTRARLDQAGLVVLCAPTSRYRPRERALLRDWVRDGGNLIITAGYERAGPVRDLLEDFQISIGLNPRDSSGGTREPLPLGHFKSPFIRVQDEFFHVRFHAAWPVWCTDVDLADPAYFGSTDPRIMAYGPDNVPVIVLRPIGRGKVVVIGDSNFATNQNLENVDGEPFEGLRENAEFWRFLLGELRGERWEVQRLEQPTVRRGAPAQPTTAEPPFETEPPQTPESALEPENIEAPGAPDAPNSPDAPEPVVPDDTLTLSQRFTLGDDRPAARRTA